MKNLYFLAFLVISFSAAAQVGIGIPIANPSAQLDVSSTTKGFLPPRLDSNQRNAIVAPVAGLTIYNTQSKTLECYNGTSWNSTAHYIGENYGGGIVFYVYDNGQHGLIAATTNANGGVGVRWSAGTYTTTMAVGGRSQTGTGMGAGKLNTQLIIASQGTGDGATYAARICQDYSVTSGNVTYQDWYLPSLEELNLLYLQKNIVGGLGNSNFWSSSESVSNLSWIKFFWDGNTICSAKNNAFMVRPVRAF